MNLEKKRVKRKYYMTKVIIIFLVFCLTNFLSFCFGFPAKQSGKSVNKIKTIYSSTIELPDAVSKSPLKYHYLTGNYEGMIEEYNRDKNYYDSDYASLYLLAKMYDKEKDYQKSLEFYNKLLSHNVKENKIIRNYLYYFVGRILYKLEKYEDALQFLEKIIHECEITFPYLKNTFDIIGNSYIRIKKYSKMIEVLKPFTTISNDDVLLVVNYYLGSAYNLLKNHDKTIEYYIRAYRISNRSAASLISKDIDMLETKYKKNEKLNFLIACVLSESKNTKNRKKALTYFYNIFPPENIEDKFLYYYHIVKIFLYQKNYKEAYKYAYKLYEELKDTEKVDKILFLLSNVLEKINKSKSITMYQTLINSENVYKKNIVEEAYKKVIQYNKEQNNYEKYTSLMKRYLKYNDYSYVYDELIELINNKKYDIISKKFSQIVMSIEYPKYLTKLCYWMGVVEEKLNNYNIAIQYYQTSFLNFQNSFYAFQSYFRLIELAKKHKEAQTNDIIKQVVKEQELFFGSDDFRKKVRTLYQNVNFSEIKNPNFKRAYLFYTLGDMYNGNNEWKMYVDSMADDEKARYYLAYYEMFNSIEMPMYAVRYIDHLIKYLNGYKKNNYIPYELGLKSYPKMYSDVVSKYSKEYKVDDLMIWSIMRQESRYYQYSLSWAGATGLMQLMPSTARGMDSSLSDPEIYNIDHNIKLGTRYFSSMKRMFDNDAFALGGYNWGPGNMRRFLRKLKSNPSLNQNHTIERIRVDETRNYIKIVLTNYYIYNSLYMNK